MRPQHTPEQLERTLGRYDLGIRWNLSAEEVQSILHYLAEYRRLAEGKSMLADGTVAMEDDLVWHRGDQFLVIGRGTRAYRRRPDDILEWVDTNRCYPTREASMESEECK